MSQTDRAVHCRAFAEERAQALGTSLQELTGKANSSSGGFFETGEEARRRWREQRDQADKQDKQEPVSVLNRALFSGTARLHMHPLGSAVLHVVKSRRREG